MNSPEATIDGQVILGSSPARWVYRYGTTPSYESFDVTPKSAAILKEKTFKSPVQLVIKGRDRTMTVKNLYVVGIFPTDNPKIMRVVVADCRIWWKYALVVRRYNIRRNVGYKRLKATDTPELNPTAPQIWYAAYSLDLGSKKGNGTTPIEAKDAVTDVLNDAARVEREGGAHTMGVRFKKGLTLNEVPIEQLEIEENGDDGVRRILSYFPECDVYIDKDGDAVITSKADGSERELVDAIRPEMVGAGHVETVDMRSVRPSLIRFYFVREIEVRHDFIEVTSAQSVGTTTDDPLGDLRRAENVLPIPDYQLTVNGQTLVQGTWITVDEALRAWGTPPGLSRLDHDLIQRAFVPYLDLWTALQINGVRDPNADWTARLSMLQQHYRRTYRINRRWMDRTLSLRDYRVALIDPVRGQRAPAQAWADYCTVPSMRALWKQASGSQDLSYVQNMRCYPVGGNLSSSDRPSPAEVSILDEDQGIIHLEYKLDPLKNIEMILPSMVTLNGQDGTISTADPRPTTPGPSANMRDRTRPITFNAVVNSSGWPKLTSAHKVLFILTHVPASPNTLKQLHKIEIKPDDKELQKLMPAAAKAGLGNAGGPPMEVFIGPGQETAKIAWVDSKATEIEKAFGVTDGEPNLAGLVINEAGPSDPSRGASLTTIARAMAARIYGSMTDRYQGSLSGGVVPDLEPTGWAAEVTHELNTKGVVMTSLHLPERIPQLSIYNLLDGSTRGIMMRLAQVR